MTALADQQEKKHPSTLLVEESKDGDLNVLVSSLRQAKTLRTPNVQHLILQEDLVGVGTPSKLIAGMEVHTANAPVNPAREMMQHRMALAEQIGILGPCSFENCEDFADYRCGWKNLGRLADGGCQELYCAAHGYTPEKGKDPPCCLDCVKAFNNDKYRVRAVIGLVVSIFVLTLVTIILLFTVVLKDDSDSDEISSVPAAAKRQPIIIPTTTDVRVFSESLGYEMAIDVNLQREAEGKQTLTWADDWQNLAFRVAVDSSADVDIQDQLYLNDKYFEMDLSTQLLFNDQELSVVEVPQDTNAIVEALKVIDGGEESSLTHIAIAVYAKDDIMYFSQVLGAVSAHSDGL